MKTVREVFQDCRGVGCNTPLDQIHAKRKERPAMYARVLLACTATQAAILTELWAPLIGTDIPARMFWLRIVQNGEFPEFLDVEKCSKVTSRYLRDTSVNN